jgi:hypothetical protein
MEDGGNCARWLRRLAAILVLLLTLTSGVTDARGFVYAGRAWPDGSLDWTAVGRSMLAFLAGISAARGVIAGLAWLIAAAHELH